jgi:hypothetical protein
MRPHIDGSKFGSITIEGERFGHDVLIRLDGQVIKREKGLSVEITSELYQGLPSSSRRQAGTTARRARATP